MYAELSAVTNKHSTSCYIFYCLVISHEELCATFSKFDLKRLELYSRSMAEHYMITDLLPSR